MLTSTAFEAELSWDYLFTLDSLKWKHMLGMKLLHSHCAVYTVAYDMYKCDDACFKYVILLLYEPINLYVIISKNNKKMN